MSPLILIIIFVVSTLLGYKVIGQVPSLLHTPLMSGMNAFCGIIVLGALTTTAKADHLGGVLAIVLGVIALALIMIHNVGGFAITHRMLKMFKSKG